MKNITKVGLSALAGSLVMVSANAVEYSMSGGLQSVYSTQDSPTGADTTNGKGLTTQTDLSFNASGELDNGFTVGYFMFLDTDGNVSNTSSQLTVGMGSLGTLQINNKVDQKLTLLMMSLLMLTTKHGMVYHTELTLQLLVAERIHGSLDYRIPAQELMGVTLNASVTLDPNANEGSVLKVVLELLQYQELHTHYN